jgi:hypothetical protein
MSKEEIEMVAALFDPVLLNERRTQAFRIFKHRDKINGDRDLKKYADNFSELVMSLNKIINDLIGVEFTIKDLRKIDNE